MSRCPVEVRVFFTYSTQEIDPTHVDQMHLYLFSPTGYFVGEYIDNSIAKFDENYSINCSDVTPGDYRFIAWGGKDERFYSTVPSTFVKGQTTFDEALLALEHSGNTLSTPIHSLFHSDLFAVVAPDKRIQRIDMPLVQITNTINISTIGLPPHTDAYTFNITDINCSYRFDHSFAPHTHEPFTYTTACTKDNESQLHATLRVMRLSADRHTPQLQIINKTTGSVLYPVGNQSGDLIGLILKANPNNNFNTNHTYDIVLTFIGDEETGFDVSITINGWEVREEENELID
jgi:hypothetical protein